MILRIAVDRMFSSIGARRSPGVVFYPAVSRSLVNMQYSVFT